MIWNAFVSSRGKLHNYFLLHVHLITDVTARRHRDMMQSCFLFFNTVSFGKNFQTTLTYTYDIVKALFSAKHKS